MRILENKIVILRKKVGILKVNIVGNLRKSQNCGEKKSKILGKKLELREKKKIRILWEKSFNSEEQSQNCEIKSQSCTNKKKGQNSSSSVCR